MSRIYFSLALLLTLSACDTQTPEAEAPLIPLDLGNAWVFQVERTSGSNVGQTREPDTLRVVAKTEWDGTEWSELRASRSLGGLDGFYAEIDGDMWYASEEGDTGYRLYVRDAANYSVISPVYDADVRATSDTAGALEYVFDYNRIRILSQEFLVEEDTPVTRHSFDAGVGFNVYESTYFFNGGAATGYVRAVAVDTYTRLAFLPAVD